ncbi:hypothetical protein IJG22_03810, partial [Candidatus Saccharibacteria bacterium]|nr:hypothetical protein [Candidatus Saccharibacteria bacterium]
SNQAADTYVGQVKYTMVHPYDAATPIIPKTIANATTMQEVNTCPDTLTSGQIYTLIDSRDQQEYKVAKLADGKCWMVENLALDPTDSTTAANMNATNTNASAVAIYNYLNGGGGMAGWSSMAVSNNTLVHWNSNDYTEPLIDNQYKGTSITGYGPASNDGQAEAGIYYNYCAATAGTYCYDSGNSIDLPDTNIDAPEDICPANWRMPTGGEESEYEVLFNEYNTTQDATNVASLQYNWSATLSGYRLYNFEDRGYIGHWWSSTYSFGSFMNALHISNSWVNSYSDSRSMGYSVRCLLKTN